MKKKYFYELFKKILSEAQFSLTFLIQKHPFDKNYVILQICHVAHAQSNTKGLSLFLFA
jgi:hypothetical protein